MKGRWLNVGINYTHFKVDVFIKKFTDFREVKIWQTIDQWTGITETHKSKSVPYTSYVCTEWIFDSQQFEFIYNKIFLEKNLVEVFILHLHASFGTFYAKIGQ